MSPRGRGRSVVRSPVPHQGDTMTTSPLRRLASACAGLLALCGMAAAVAAAGPAPATSPGDTLDPRTYAADSKAFLLLHGVGVQKYTCQANGTWLFTDPVATLYKTPGARKAVGTHFLNFATGRPVWRVPAGAPCREAAQGA